MEESAVGRGNGPLRLLIVTAFWPNEANKVTGIFVLQQARAWVRMGHSVTVVAPQAAGKTSPVPEPEPGVEVWSPRYASLPRKVVTGQMAYSWNVRSFGRAVRRVLARLRREGTRFDAVHVHGVLYSGLSLPHWRHLAGRAALVTLHGRDPLLQEQAATRWMARRLDEVWAHADVVTAVGRPLLDYADLLRVPRGKLHVVPNGCDEPPAGAAGGGQRPLNGVRRVASVSNLVDWKGIDLNLRALAAVAARRPELRWEYVAVGEGPERASLAALAAELGLEDRVRFTGRLAYGETMAEIAAADVFSLPSWAEPFGIVYLEAMARGRPVIGCLGGGAEEVVRGGTDGILVPPRNVEALADAIDALLADPARAAALGGAGRGRARQFSWDASAEAYLELLAGARAPHPRVQPA